MDRNRRRPCYRLGLRVAPLLLAALAAAGCGAPSPAAQPTAAPKTATTSASPGRSADPARSPAPAQATDSRTPTGLLEGTDSWPVPVTGAGPYGEPSLGESYGGYIGMAGSWSYWLGCHGSFLAWSGTNSEQADANYSRYGEGIGTAVYWFMGGPGVDPHYTGTTAEAAAWGARQAVRALASMARLHVTYPVLFMDIELPGIAPAPDNGWDDVYTSPCSGVVKQKGMSSALDRADLNGFWDYLTAHSSYKPGVYSDAVTWTQVFGTGSYASVPNAYEWTYEPETADLSDAPDGWCLKSDAGCAAFFGGVTSASAHAVMWQWSGGGGVRNAIGDFDLIDATRLG